jgi:hypothetical protein
MEVDAPMLSQLTTPMEVVEMELALTATSTHKENHCHP